MREALLCCASHPGPSMAHPSRGIQSVILVRPDTLAFWDEADPDRGWHLISVSFGLEARVQAIVGLLSRSSRSPKSGSIPERYCWVGDLQVLVIVGSR
jgi:hypothetical protein